MAIEKQTSVNQIEVTENGTVQIRFAIDLVEDGKVIDRKWHRTSCPPGHDIEAQIAAVNAHLTAMGKEKVKTADVVKIRAHTDVAWTPEVIEAHKARVEADRFKLGGSE